MYSGGHSVRAIRGEGVGEAGSGFQASELDLSSLVEKDPGHTLSVVE
jgi:hypothetical protein